MTIIFIGAVFSSYLFKGQNLESNIYTVLFIIEVPFFFSLIPMIGIYSIFKKAKKTFLISALMIIFFLLLLISIKLLNISTYSFSINNLFLTILSFIISIIYLELGMKTTDFDLIVNRITNNKKHKNESLLIGFNTMLNKYLLIISILFLLSFLFTFIFVNTEILSNIFEFGFKTGSIENIILFTIILILIPISFWFFSMDLPKKVEKN